MGFAWLTLIPVFECGLAEGAGAPVFLCRLVHAQSLFEISQLGEMDRNLTHMKMIVRSARVNECVTQPSVFRDVDQYWWFGLLGCWVV